VASAPSGRPSPASRNPSTGGAGDAVAPAAHLSDDARHRHRHRFLACSAVQVRFLGDTSRRSILLRVADTIDTSLAEEAATAFLTRRHGTKDFFVLDTDDIRRTVTATTRTLTLLVAAIAVISLVVGGIGVMNIVLVSVSERVKEIGVRMAVGARRSDLLRPFLTEAVLVCLIGGVAGVVVAVGAGRVATALGSGFVFVCSTTTILAAFACSTTIGIVFGRLPAHGAALLDPVAAPARDLAARRAAETASDRRRRPPLCRSAVAAPSGRTLPVRPSSDRLTRSSRDVDGSATAPGGDIGREPVDPAAATRGRPGGACGGLPSPRRRAAACPIGSAEIL
jgi:hypothetical protein